MVSRGDGDGGGGGGGESEGRKGEKRNEEKMAKVQG